MINTLVFKMVYVCMYICVCVCVCVCVCMYSTSGKDWKMKWQPTPVFLPRESCGQRTLVGCCP